MRPKYIYSSRHTRRARDPKRANKQKFPEVLQKVINESDIILEVLDSRFIEDTRNLEVEKAVISLKKQVIYVLNKSDLTDSKVPEDFPKPYVQVSAKDRIGVKELRDKIKIYSKKVKKEERVVVGVIGYPNTGKSTIINVLIGKAKAKTAPEGGFTKGMQKLKLDENIVLLDSPGVIPKIEYTTVENRKLARHAKVGAKTSEQVKDPESIIHELMKEYPKVLEKYYSIEADGDSEILLEELGRKFSLLKKGGVVNFDKVSRKILKDWQEGRIRLDETK